MNAHIHPHTHISVWNNNEKFDVIIIIIEIYTLEWYLKLGLGDT